MEKTTRSGAMTLGLQTGEASSHAIMDRGLETGVHFYGTANRYRVSRAGRYIHLGFTEENSGR